MLTPVLSVYRIMGVMLPTLGAERRAIVVVGLGYGDESKGATVDYLASVLDDTVAVVAKRLATYHEMTKPLEDYYHEQGVLAEVDAAKSPDEVFARMADIVRSRWEGGS